MAELRDVATDIIAWVNDIVSFRKESAFHDPHNLISVLMAEEHLDADQATQAATPDPPARHRLGAPAGDRLRAIGRMPVRGPTSMACALGSTACRAGPTARAATARTICSLARTPSTSSRTRHDVPRVPLIPAIFGRRFALASNRHCSNPFVYEVSS